MLELEIWCLFCSFVGRVTSSPTSSLYMSCILVEGLRPELFKVTPADWTSPSSHTHLCQYFSSRIRNRFSVLPESRLVGWWDTPVEFVGVVITQRKASTRVFLHWDFCPFWSPKTQYTYLIPGSPQPSRTLTYSSLPAKWQLESLLLLCHLLLKLRIHKW